MGRTLSTRRLVMVTALGGVAFGVVMTALLPALMGKDLSLGALVPMGLFIAVGFGGSMFAVFYLGWVRPRQLDPDPPEFADRRVTARERLWGDGRPLPVWVRRMMYVSAVVFFALGVINLVGIVGGWARPWQLASGVVMLAMAVLGAVTARRGREARPPYSDHRAHRNPAAISRL